MDPSQPAASRASAGFPRPRGDGPTPLLRASTGRAVSPPTRGWTPEGCQQGDARPGFPAHAGMDLRGQAEETAAQRFPRPRGDGPCSFDKRSGNPAVSPPTRGWTPFYYEAGRRVGGFPAHAGMDLSLSAVNLLIHGFPRPRGDGPEGEYEGSTEMEVSPPTRGWTSHHGRLGPRSLGFPAHAGMDPSRISRSR